MYTDISARLSAVVTNSPASHCVRCICGESMRSEHSRKKSRDRSRSKDRNRRHKHRDYREDDRQRDQRRETKEENGKGPKSEETEDQSRDRNRSRSPRPWDKNKKRDFRGDDDGGAGKKYEWGKASDKQDLKSSTSAVKSEEGEKPKEQPNFEVTGKLAEDTNKFKGVLIKYNEPPEACKPKLRWRLYPFKDNESLPTLYVHRQSAYLIGKDRRIVDLPIDHPSCSKQHAVLQYRQVAVKQGERTLRRIKPYIIDLESSNGTFLNNKKIEPKKYYELMEKDVLKFGFSTREYVVLHEYSLDAGGDGQQQDPSSDRRTDDERADDGDESASKKVKTEPVSE